jgi:DNA ligase-associated metallophosphoesterase
LFEVVGEAALYWPAQNALLVSDLHLEKASAYALNGQMLPPYDSIATLEDIAALCTKYTPAKILSLGDNFHDDDGEARLAEPAAALLVDLARDTEWLWITGNHDRAVSGIWGGKTHDEICLSGITFRHEAQRGDPNFSPEVPTGVAWAHGGAPVLCQKRAQNHHARIWSTHRRTGCAGQRDYARLRRGGWRDS